MMILPVIACTLALSSTASAQRVLTLEMVPTERAQIAVWIADAEGDYLATVALTQSVARRGIGNRPGASMMNSGYRWPYGRREGVLPIWAHARAEAPGAERFRRVIFQDRTSEGHASRSSDDSSRDDYYCLTFDAMDSSRDRLDAVSCASVFMSDKGRFVTEEDVAAEYFEPQQIAGRGSRYLLDLESLYPPRRDVVRCAADGCVDHPDVAAFLSDAERVMPELDAVTMATPRGEEPLAIMYSVPEDWENGLYQVLIEVNAEGDWNEDWGPDTYPTPSNDPAMGTLWDYWAENFGYPFRGQPSVLYRVEIEVTDGIATASAAMPVGYGSLSGQGPDGGEVTPLDDSMTNDPRGTPGSGVDRLHAGEDGARVRLSSIGATACQDDAPPDAPGELVVSAWTGDYRDAHRFAHLSFTASGDDVGIARYEVRVSSVPITDVPSFLRGVPANGATLESEGLRVPSSAPAGTEVVVDLGGLSHETHYWIGMRAVDRCNVASALSVVEYTTPEITFTTVSPCFVATATYGDPMASELGTLRRFRDRYLESNAVGHAWVEAYYAVGPSLARFIEGSEGRRTVARRLLAPAIELARWLER